MGGGGDVSNHHANLQETIPGYWEVARPLRDTSWWHRRKQERACGQRTSHCWHPADAMIAWFCCMCSAELDGMPPRRCIYCPAKEQLAQTVGDAG
jgi:hypothetical protein